MQEAIVRFLRDHGALAQPEALQYLASLPEPMRALKEGLARSELPFLLTLADARRLTGAPDGVPAPTPLRAPPEPPPAPVLPRSAAPAATQAPTRAYAAAAPARTVAASGPRLGTATVLSPPRSTGAAAPEPRIVADVSGNSTCEGSIEDFAKLFRDRFGRMRRLYRKRPEMGGATTIDRVPRNGSQAKFLAIVNEKRTTRNGHRLLEVEDETGQAAVLVPAKDQKLIEIADRTLSDEVVGIVGRVATRGARDDGLIILDELIRPDLPRESPRRWGATGGMVVVSDVHIGSDTFLPEAWDAFIDWLAGRRREHRELAEGVRWLVINGDLVDGVGIYPGQEAHLSIPDVMDQYAEAARMLRRVPEHVRIIIAPGNHDAVRPAEPQPSFPQAIKDLFGPNVTCVGNPCWLDLDGVLVLAYHGVSLFDYFQALPHVDINKPLETMREMLIRRHLCPIYGGKTPLAPEHRDHMVIEQIPDVFITGHVHAADVAEWRNVSLINASTWQDQTDYQKMLGFVPDPCKAFHLDLATGTPTTLSFLDAADVGDPTVTSRAARRLVA